MKLVAIDFETSGYGGDSACALGVAVIRDDQIVDHHYSLIRPPSSKILFTEIHGLTWDMLKDAGRFAEVWPEFAPLLAGADYFLAHNATFDRRVLLESCRAAGIREPQTPFLCTLMGCRKKLDIPSRKLSAVCEHFGIELDHHHAGSDANACAEVYLALTRLGLQPEQMKI